MSVIEREAPVVETPVEADIPSQLLEAAAEYIEKYGWFGGGTRKVSRGQNPDHAHAPSCAAVAIHKSYEDCGANEDDVYDAMVRLATVIRGDGEETQFSFPSSKVFDWNDSPGRTAQEVCRVLREAAARPS